MTVSFRQHREFLIDYLRPQRLAVAVMSVLLLGSIALQLVTPQILSRFIDAARAGGAPDTLVRLAVLSLMVAGAGQLVSTCSAYASENVGWAATNKVREDLALHCLQLDLPFHNAKTPGEMIERVDGDVTQLSSFFSQFVLRVFGNAVLLVGILVLLFRADWRVGIVYSVFTVTALVILRRLIESAVPYWKEARQTSAILLGFLEERLSGTEDIRASGAVPYVMRRLYEALRNQLDKSRRAWLRGTMLWATTPGLRAVGNAIAFGMGAYLLRQGVITLGTVYLFFHYAELLRRPLEQITRQIQELQRASASISRVGDLFALGTATKDGPRRLPAGPLGVDVDRVAFGYVEGDLVLEDISVHLAPGRVLGLLGRTGSGKTTAGRLFVRFYDPTAGAIRLGGTDIRDIPLADLRNRVGLVTQDVQLFHASVRQNLTFFNPGISDARILEVLHALGLVEWMESLPHGLDTQIGPRALSAGEAQLLAFARVFFKDPGLVILDEASSRLDPATEQLLERAVSTWRVLGRLLIYQPGLYALNMLLWTAFWLTPLLVGLVTRAIFNSITHGATVQTGLLSLLALLLGVAAARVVINVWGVGAWATYFFSRAALLRSNLLERILGRPGARALPDSPGEAMSRFRDDVEELLRLVEMAVDGVGIVLAGIIGAAIMFRINPVITKAVLVPLVLIIGVVATLRRRILRYRREAREAAGRVTDLIAEMFGAVQAVKVAGAEDHVIAHFRTLNETRRRASLRDSLLTEVLGMVFSSSVNLGTGLILLLGGQSIRAGTFTVGDFVLFVFYLSLVTEAMTAIGNFSARIRQAGVSVQRLVELLQDEPPERLLEYHPVYLSGPLPQVGFAEKTEVDRLETLTVRGLTFRDPVTGRGVEDVNFTLTRGSFTVVTGRIGSGKSTLVRVLIGLLPRDAGEIDWHGQPVR